MPHSWQFDISSDAQLAAHKFRQDWFQACEHIDSTPWLRGLIDDIGFYTVRLIVSCVVYRTPWEVLGRQLGMERHAVKRMATEATEILAHETLLKERKGRRKPGPKPSWQTHLNRGHHA